MQTFNQKITRRDMLKLGLLGGAALMLPLERTARTASSINNRLLESQLPQPFQVPFAFPPVLKPVGRTGDGRSFYKYLSRPKLTRERPSVFAIHDACLLRHNRSCPGTLPKGCQEHSKRGKQGNCR